MECDGLFFGRVGLKSSLSLYYYTVSRETPSFLAISATLSPRRHLWRIEFCLDMLIISFPDLLRQRRSNS